jgi:hypothetical protein
VQRLVLPLSVVLPWCLALAPAPSPTAGVSAREVQLAPLAATVPAAAPRVAADRLSEILPKGSVAVFRARSIQAVIDEANRLFGGGAEEPFTVESLLEPLGAGEIVARVALDRPIGVAVRIGEGMEPQVWAAVPVTDSAAFVAALPAEQGLVAFAEGDYALVGQGLERPEGGTTLGARALAASSTSVEILSVDVDVESIYDAFEPLIEMGLGQAEAQADATGDGAAATVAAEQISRVRDMLESARTFRLALRTSGTKVEVAGALTIGEGSPMTDWVPDTRVDLSRAASLIDPSAMLSFVSFAPPTEEWTGQLDFLDSLAETLPEDFGKLIDLEARVLRDLAPLMSGMTAASVDLVAAGSEGSLRSTSYVESKDPGQLVAALARTIAAPEFAELGIEITPSAPREIGGKTWAEFRLRVDVESLVLAFDSETQIPPEELAEAEQALATLLGPDGLRIGMTESGGMVVCRVGGDDAYAARALQRIGATPSNLPAGLANAFAGARSVNSGWLGQLDLGRLMNQISDLGSSLGEPVDLPVALVGETFPLTLHMVVEDLTWRGALELDSDDLRRFVAAMKQ